MTELRAQNPERIVFQELTLQSGEETSRTNFVGELAMGLFGGDAEEAVDAVVESFIDYMKQ